MQLNRETELVTLRTFEEELRVIYSYIIGLYIYIQIYVYLYNMYIKLLHLSQYIFPSNIRIITTTYRLS